MGPSGRAVHSRRKSSHLIPEDKLRARIRPSSAAFSRQQRLVELRTLELQKLSGELLRVQDEERRKMARALHDDLAQELTALKIELDVRVDSERPNLGYAKQLAESALNKVRNMSYLLHPPLLDESELMPALHWYLEGLQKRGPLHVSFEYRPRIAHRRSIQSPEREG